MSFDTFLSLSTACDTLVHTSEHLSILKIIQKSFVDNDDDYYYYYYYLGR